MTSFIQLYPFSGLILHYTWFVMHSLIYDFWISTRVCCNTKINEGNTVFEYIFLLSIYVFTPPHHHHRHSIWHVAESSYLSSPWTREMSSEEKWVSDFVVTIICFSEIITFLIVFLGFTRSGQLESHWKQKSIKERNRFPKKGQLNLNNKKQWNCGVRH